MRDIDPTSMPKPNMAFIDLKGGFCEINDYYICKVQSNKTDKL
jgi:hypothetical protein